MPDMRRHRGRHPEDSELFSASRISALRSATADFSWLLTRAYGEISALKIVGDRYALTARQRLAVRRSACSDLALEQRSRKRAPLEHLSAAAIGIDGYNQLITLEVALSGGVILIGRDGCYRDLAGVHGTYRQVLETTTAIELLLHAALEQPSSRLDIFLDRPVSNSGRLKKRIDDTLESLVSRCSKSGLKRTVQLIDRPDAVLVDYEGVVATSDSALLDRCLCWCGLAEHVITNNIPQAWTVDLRAK